MAALADCLPLQPLQGSGICYRSKMSECLMDLSEGRDSSSTATTTCQTALPEPALWQSHCKNQECPPNDA